MKLRLSEDYVIDADDYRRGSSNINNPRSPSPYRTIFIRNH